MLKLLAVLLVTATCCLAKPPSESTDDELLDVAKTHFGRDDIRITDRSCTRSSGVTHLYLTQTLNGVPIYDSHAQLHLLKDGKVLKANGSFQDVPRPRSTRATRKTREQIIARVGEQLELKLKSPIREVEGGFEAPGFCDNKIFLERMYCRVGDELVDAWSLYIRPPDTSHQWHILADATTGDLLYMVDTVLDVSYRAFALPIESPNKGSRTLEVDPARTNASPYGWHDTNGVAGAEFTDTRGNNIFCSDDISGFDRPGARGSGGTNELFDPSLDVTLHPFANVEAALVNAFYTHNILHDVFWAYGFDEAAGNFQENNYGRGGTGGDSLEVQVMDTSDINNARYYPAVEGTGPLIEYLIWYTRRPLTISSPAFIAGEYTGNVGGFGTELTGVSITGEIVRAFDTGTSQTDACEAITNNVTGKIALIDRGNCTFAQKLHYAGDAGALAAIIVNNTGEELTHMRAEVATNAIPSIMIFPSDGDTIANALTTTVTGVLTSFVRPASLDNGVIIHEYAHGVSTRLTGGPSVPQCLSGPVDASLGEGWSDFFMIALTTSSNSTRNELRDVAAWLDPNGIRADPYTTDDAVNTNTFAAFSARTSIHHKGEIWAVMLWELYWDMVDTWGYNSDIYGGDAGNNKTLQLVIDAMKLQPCKPGFLEARDAIIDADTAAYGGTNLCLIWGAFASRGLGFSASTNPLTAAFDLPGGCP